MKKILIIFSFFFPLSLFSNDKIKIEFLSQFYLDQKKELITKSWDIGVDEQENIYVVDGTSSNVKIFNKEGKIVKISGRKGGGPGEFMHPFRIDINDKWICVQDVGALKYIVFDKEFKEVRRFFYLLSPNDSFVMDEDRIITNGFFCRQKWERV